MKSEEIYPLIISGEYDDNQWLYIYGENLNGEVHLLDLVELINYTKAQIDEYVYKFALTERQNYMPYIYDHEQNK
jgi:hypothetical protein